MFAKKIVFFVFVICTFFFTLSNAKDQWSGTHYEKNSSMQEESAFFLLDTIAFKSNNAVLDIGCGEGKITAQVAQHIPDGFAVGLDVSENMIQAAKDKHKDQKNISFVVADASDFTLEQKFDYAISFYALHWVKELGQALKNIKNVLKPGGTVMVKIATMHKTCPIQGFFDSLDPDGKWGFAKAGRKKTFHGSSTIEEFEAALDYTGFKHKDVRLIDESFYFENFDTLVQWFMGWMPHCVQLSRDETELFLNDFVADIYAKQNKKHNESIVYTFPVLQAIAS